LLSLTNIDPEKSYPISIDLRGGEVQKITGRILTSTKLNDHNSFENPHEVEPQNFTDFSIKGGTLHCTIPAHSFITFSFTSTVN
jgi:alpha-N-arabinofuranosidase